MYPFDQYVWLEITKTLTTKQSIIFLSTSLQVEHILPYIFKLHFHERTLCCIKLSITPLSQQY